MGLALKRSSIGTIEASENLPQIVGHSRAQHEINEYQHDQIGF